MPDNSTGHRHENDAGSDQAQVFDELLAAYASTAGIILDSEYRYLWLNERLAALNGLQPSEHLGKTVREVIGQIADEIEPYLQRVFSTGASILNVEISGAHSARKTTVHRRQHFFPIKGKANHVARVGVVVTEIRDAKKFQKEIEDRDRRLQAGETVGLSATISGMPYEVTAEAATPCQLGFVDRKHFTELMASHSEIGVHTAHCLSREYQSAYRDIHDLVLTRSSAGKLARLLLSQAPRHDDKVETRVQTPMTHEEMAQRIGASRETVTRLLSHLRKQQLIRLDGPNLVIRDRPGLEALTI